MKDEKLEEERKENENEEENLVVEKFFTPFRQFFSIIYWKKIDPLSSIITKRF